MPRQINLKRSGPNGERFFVKGERRRIHQVEQCRSFTERGGASWYGPDFLGKKLAYVPRFKQPIHMPSNTPLAAHKTLPLPCWVLITETADPSNTLVCPVLDRGPYHPGRIIDLNPAAAQAMKMIRVSHHGSPPQYKDFAYTEIRGVINVTIEVVDPPDQGEWLQYAWYRCS